METTSTNKNPILQASRFSRFFHCWLSPLIDKSRKQGTLHLDDLYAVPDYLESGKLINRLEANWFDEKQQYPQNPSLIRATLRTMDWKFMLNGLLLIPIELLNIFQPLLLVYFIKFFEPCTKMFAWQACLIVLTIVMVLICENLLFHQYVHRVITYGIQMRVSYSGLIFRKVLRLSSHAMTKSSSGEITNLLANDAQKVELLYYCLNFLWVVPLQVIAVIFVLWSYIKYITFIGLGYTLFLLFLQPVFSRLFLYLRTQVLKITDERVKIMSEIIKSMRIVKVYCWESAFEKKVRRIRARECMKNTVYMMCTSIESALSQSYLSVAFLMMYAVMWSFRMHFDTGVFALLYALVSYLRISCVLCFNLGIRDLLNYIAAQKRIRTFLLLDESERDNRLLSTSFQNIVDIHKNDHNSTKQQCKLICDIKQAQWEQNEKFSLKNIQFDAYPGDLVCIIGPVGCGKSSLLQTLTESWIFSSSIKNNILFGKEYDSKLFQHVVQATALDTDFVQLSHGADTLVGDQGVTLSGGQKARVNMARALYRNADIYLLDDPLSAVDAKVSKHLFEKSIKKYLHDKICILVTHQIQFVQYATKIILLDNDGTTQMGTYEELLISSTLFRQLLEDINQHETDQEPTILATQQSTISSIKSEEKRLEEKDQKPLPKNIETKQEGIVKWKVYMSYLRAAVGIVFGLLLILIIFSSQQIIAMYSNWWLATWSNDESRRHHNLTDCLLRQDNITDKISLMNDYEWNTFRNQRFYIFAILVCVLVLLTFIRAGVCRLLCLNAARVLHNQMFMRIIRCPISFFDMNPVGRILNRFTSDVAAMDDSLPVILFEFLSSLSQVLGTVVMVGIFNPWSFIPALIAVSGMLVLRRRFASCARDLKRLQGTTRSPVYSQLTSTIHGLQVIRSFHAENVCSKEFEHHLDNNTRTAFLSMTLNRWSAMRFDWVTLVFVSAVIILSVVARIIQNALSTVEIALTLTYSISLVGLFQASIRQSVEAENQMTSVERVLEYCSLDQEPPAQLSSKDQLLPTNWPSQGRIVFHNVSMSHSKEPNAPLALHNISLTIQPKEKIGIVGRTGAGKSSFIQILFRMGTLVNGHITIDNIDITTIGLDDLRHRISIIPQDPVLFTGTMRSNLDPFGIYSDAELWNALEQVQLKKLVTDIMSNGLHSLVSESGSNLSVGQKQLVCLARAILKKSKILVIDEATANVDNATDELIQKAIREKFKECTVLTIAHRLRSVIDSDRIMVLNEGTVVEFDSPRALLDDAHSHFSLLVQQTGVAEAEHLRKLAYSNRSMGTDKEERPESDDEVPIETNESDPLVRSTKPI